MEGRASSNLKSFLSTCVRLSLLRASLRLIPGSILASACDTSARDLPGQFGVSRNSG